MNLKKKRWIILAVSLLVNICIGSGYAWSVFSNTLSEDFGWSATGLALPFTIANAVACISMILGGRIQDKYGPKWVVVLGGLLFGGGYLVSGIASPSLAAVMIGYGIIGGLGMGFVYSCTLSNTVKFFPDKRGFVSGLVLAGYGGAPMIFAPVLQAIITATDVMFTFKLLGGFVLTLIVVGAFFMTTAPVGYKPEGWTPKAIDELTPVNEINKNWPEMLKDAKFYILLLLFALGTMTGLMFISQASAMTQEIVGVGPALAALVVSFIAFSNLFGRIFWGWVSDKFGRYKIIPFMFLISCLTMFVLTLIGGSTYVGFIILIMLVGFCYGGFLGVFPALTADLFGTKNYGVNYGIVFIGFAIAGYIGPYIAASAKTANNGDYTVAFIIAAILPLAGILFTLLLKKLQRKEVAKLKG